MIAPEDFSADSPRAPAGPTGGAEQAAVRAQVVAQGRVLIADGKYPSRETLRNVSRSILASAEWHEDSD
jgi:hypothetical protein